ncbi:hypothetical protein [Agrobacterium tumefaciens]|uniref:hypothetical protein n=1 Tax=Agrobacterium tumefaciens TaxID=358 RepID=UPI0015733BC7|nr:hypothetical protein [Agrobacterium tumefaciens]
MNGITPTMPQQAANEYPVPNQPRRLANNTPQTNAGIKPNSQPRKAREITDTISALSTKTPKIAPIIELNIGPIIIANKMMFQVVKGGGRDISATSYGLFEPVPHLCHSIW